MKQANIRKINQNSEFNLRKSFNNVLKCFIIRKYMDKMDLVIRATP